MRIGLFFGSFNPPHIGHTVIASYMKEAMNADEVWMVVSPQNPFKEAADLLDEQNRLNLVILAIQGLDGIKASDFEFDLERPSYTIDSMKALSNRHPEHEFFLIMGSDNILQIAHWKNWERLLSDYQVAVYPRKGYPVPDSFKTALPENVSFIDCPLIDLSSTEVRARISGGKTYHMLLRKAVADEISKANFYR